MVKIDTNIANIYVYYVTPLVIFSAAFNHGASQIWEKVCVYP